MKSAMKMVWETLYILDEPPFCSKIHVCDVSDGDVGISNQRLNVEGIWLHK